MTIAELRARKRELDALIEAEKAATGEVTDETAYAWWDVAVALRDAVDPSMIRLSGYPRHV